MYFGYKNIHLLNTGVEADEYALRIAMKWAHLNKKVLPTKGKILVATDNFWGRTLAACSSSEEIDRYQHYGPFFNNFELFEYGNID